MSMRRPFARFGIPRHSSSLALQVSLTSASSFYFPFVLCLATDPVIPLLWRCSFFSPTPHPSQTLSHPFGLFLFFVSLAVTFDYLGDSISIIQE